MLKSRLIAWGLNSLGVGDAMVKGHSAWLRLWRVTPETSKLKRFAVELPFTTAVELAWFFPVYFASGVSKANYLRSVLISTGINSVVQMGVLCGAHILNDYATNDPVHRKNLSARLRAFPTII